VFVFKQEDMIAGRFVGSLFNPIISSIPLCGGKNRRSFRFIVSVFDNYQHPAATLLRGGTRGGSIISRMVCCLLQFAVFLHILG